MVQAGIMHMDPRQGQHSDESDPPLNLLATALKDSILLKIYLWRLKKKKEDEQNRNFQVLSSHSMKD